MAKESYHLSCKASGVFTVLMYFICLLFLHAIMCYDCNNIYFAMDDFHLCPKHCAECSLHNSCILCQTNVSGSTCKSLCKIGCVVLYLPNGTHLRGCYSEKSGNECCVSCPPYSFCSDCSQFYGTCLRCSSEFYDRQMHCDKRCGNCLPYEQGVVECDIDTGNCQGDCTDGFYGLRCNQTCKNNCLDPRTKTRRCDKYSGNCIFGCVAGWYNDSCENNCPETCAGKSCDQNTGYCTGGCVPGWYGDTCEEKCSVTCAGNSCDQNTGYCTDGCASNRYGATCEEKCSETCAGDSCDQNRGYCVNGCVSGRFGDTCQAKCSETCAGKSCDQKEGYCIDGCVSGHYGVTCEMICTSTCRNNICKQLSGLCESGCLMSWHGAKCETSCSSSCLNQTCEQISGHCKSGCSFGTYGHMCERICSSTCYNKTCNHITGSCIYGCVVGWFGDMCTELCSNTCFSRSCDQDSGLCEKGCITGYYGDMCENNSTSGNVTVPCTGCETVFAGDLQSKDSNKYSTHALIYSLVGVVSATICLLSIYFIRRAVLHRRSNLEFERSAVYTDGTMESVYDEIEDTNVSTTYRNLDIQMEHCSTHLLTPRLGEDDHTLVEGTSLTDNDTTYNDVSATLRISDNKLSQESTPLPNRDSYETPVSNKSIRHGSVVEMKTFGKELNISDRNLSGHGETSEHSDKSSFNSFTENRDSVYYLHPSS